MNEAMIVAYVGEIARKLCIASQKGLEASFELTNEGVWLSLGGCEEEASTYIPQVAISFDHDGALTALKEVSERISKTLRDHMILRDREQLQKDWEDA